MRDPDRLTENSFRAFWWAQVEAYGRHDGFCGIADLLSGIVLSRESITAEILSRAGITAQAIRSVIAPIAHEPPTSEENIPLTPNAEKAIKHAFEVSDELGHQKVDCGHILYALLSEPMVEDLREVLQTLKVNSEQLRSELFLRLRATGGA